ncbi:MAG: thioredoxin [Hyphomicrobiales bacterium]|nr:MAG: thioredoxin [Hyphomicrobiales bacterium]
MSAQDNPFGGSYAVRYGDGAADGAVDGADTGSLIKDTTTAGFAADVIQESRRQPVLVDFWAPWCGPCKQLAPALEKAVREAGGRVRLVKMNIDDHPAIAGQLGIQSIPAVIAFVDGQPVDGFMGAVPESRIREFIDKISGPGGAAEAVAEALAAAAELRAAGDLQGAAQVYAAVLGDDPAELDAIAGLAETLLDAGDEANAREVLARAPQGKQDAPQFASVKARLALAEQVAELGDPAGLERRLAADPGDHQARFDLALIQNALGERDKAADNLLAIMKADRTWQDDGARLQLLKFFEAWGMTDEATLSARRKLSSLLFS